MDQSPIQTERPRRNGGRAALSGFIYQFVGLVGLIAHVLAPPVEQETNDDLEATLACVQDAEVRSEHADADAVAIRLGIDGQDDATIFQFKYSASSSSTITRSDYTEICRKLLLNKSSLSQRVQGSVGYVLITNRALAPSCVQLRNDIHTSPEQFTEDWHQVARECRYVPIDYETWLSDIRRFASRYGVLDDEIDGGLGRLVFMLADQEMTQRAVPIDEGIVLQAFSLPSNARPLLKESLAPVIAHRTESFRSDCIADQAVDLIMREKIEEINEYATERSLVIVEGRGGTGKTVALWRWAAEIMAADEPQMVVDVEVADYLEKQWVAWIVSRWANLDPTHPRFSESNDKAFSRLQAANQQGRFVFCVGIDDLTPEKVSGGCERLPKESASAGGVPCARASSPRSRSSAS